MFASAAGCGGDVSFCSDVDSDPPNCELCANDRDDDLDGHVDCDDSDCRSAAVCRDRSSSVTGSTLDGGSTTTTITELR